MNELITEIRTAAQVIAEPNWADKVTVVLSLVSIIAGAVVALVIMCKQNKISQQQLRISAQQTKISLFNLRYETYNCILICYELAVGIVNYGKLNKNIAKEDIYDIYQITSRNFATSENQGSNIDYALVASEMMNYVSKLGQAKFLFSQDIPEYAGRLLETLLSIIRNYFIKENEGLDETISSLELVIDDFKQKRIYVQLANALDITALYKSEWSVPHA